MISFRGGLKKRTLLREGLSTTSRSIISFWMFLGSYCREVLKWSTPPKIVSNWRSVSKSPKNCQLSFYPISQRPQKSLFTICMSFSWILIKESIAVFVVVEMMNFSMSKKRLQFCHKNSAEISFNTRSSLWSISTLISQKSQICSISSVSATPKENSLLITRTFQWLSKFSNLSMMI